MNAVSQEAINDALAPYPESGVGLNWSDDLRELAVRQANYTEGNDWQGATLHNAHGSCFRRYRWKQGQFPTVSRAYALGMLAAARLHAGHGDERLVRTCHCLGRGDDPKPAQ